MALEILSTPTRDPRFYLVLVNRSLRPHEVERSLALGYLVERFPERSHVPVDMMQDQGSRHSAGPELRAEPERCYPFHTTDPHSHVDIQFLSQLRGEPLVRVQAPDHA